MVAVDIDPVEMIVGKLRKHLMRRTVMRANARIVRDRRIEQREVEIDQMQFLWLAAAEYVARERAAIGPDLGDAAARKVFHQFIARRADTAVRQQLWWNGH